MHLNKCLFQRDAPHAVRIVQETVNYNDRWRLHSGLILVQSTVPKSGDDIAYNTLE